MSKKVHFDVGESFVLFFDDGEVPFKEKVKARTLDGEYEVVSDSGNYLTLDSLYCSTDGVNYGKKQNHLTIFNNLLEQRYQGNLYLKYTFTIDVMPNQLYFLAEDMNNEWCEINGNRITFDGVSDFDKGVYKADITRFAKIGENQAVIKIKYYQSDEVYFALFDKNATEGLRNKLVYNTNIEACYLQGDFGVYERNGLIKGENKGVWIGEEFYIGEKKKVVSDLIFDGYPFFAGDITLRKKFTYSGGECVLNVAGEYGYAEVYVNNKKAVKSYFDTKVDVTSLVNVGENELIVKLFTGNRNLLGPHHVDGEIVSWAGPRAFSTGDEDLDTRYVFGENTIL